MHYHLCQDADNIVTRSRKNPARFPAVSASRASHCLFLLFAFHLILEKSRRDRCENPIFGRVPARILDNLVFFSFSLAAASSFFLTFLEMKYLQ